MKETPTFNTNVIAVIKTKFFSNGLVDNFSRKSLPKKPVTDTIQLVKSFCGRLTQPPRKNQHVKALSSRPTQTV